MRYLFTVVALGVLASGCRDPKKVEVREPAAHGHPGSQAALTCPVSGDPAREDVTYVHEGRTIHFCCADCIAPFKKDPGKYLSGGAPARGKAAPGGASREGSGAK
ncbi:MAG: YHS domain-containing protein [Planctomycetes bacterium]|nr:YHS domain-containing protein [Planctomycetota bacterium]